MTSFLKERRRESKSLVCSVEEGFHIICPRLPWIETWIFKKCSKAQVPRRKQGRRMGGMVVVNQVVDIGDPVLWTCWVNRYPRYFI